MHLASALSFSTNYLTCANFLSFLFYFDYSNNFFFSDSSWHKPNENYLWSPVILWISCNQSTLFSRIFFIIRKLKKKKCFPNLFWFKSFTVIIIFAGRSTSLEGHLLQWSPLEQLEYNLSTIPCQCFLCKKDLKPIALCYLLHCVLHIWYCQERNFNLRSGL